jgi:hypothetical protein
VFLLDDVSEDVRERASRAASRAMGAASVENPELTFQKVFPWCADNLEPDQALALISPYLDSYLEFGGYINSAENRAKIFFSEDENQFADRYRHKQIVIQQLRRKFPD